MVRTKAQPSRARERANTRTPTGWGASGAVAWWLNENVGGEVDDPPRIDSWEKAAGLTFGARIPQTLQVRGCIDAMWDLPFGMSVDELRAPSAHDPAYATLAARLLGAPVWDAPRGEGAEPQACYTLGPEATLKRLMELYFPQPDVAAFAAAAHAAGDALREAAQGGVSWATIHLALTILQYLPPAISVREHAAVGALLADSVSEVLAMAAHTLACIGPQAVAEHYEEIIEIASDPDRRAADCKRSRAETQGRAELRRQAAWLCVALLQPLHLVRLEARGAPVRSLACSPLFESAPSAVYVDQRRWALSFRVPEAADVVEAVDMALCTAPN